MPAELGRPAGSRTGHDPQSVQDLALRRIGAASQPRASAPRRIAASLGGKDAAAVTPISSSMIDPIGVPLGAVDAVEPVVARPLPADRVGRVDAGHPVHERPAADPRAGEHG